jgi:hypothetical protein
MAESNHAEHAQPIHAIIQTLDGQELSRGVIVLGAPQIRARFQPEFYETVRRMVNHLEVIAEAGNRRYRLAGFALCGACGFGPHFHFDGFEEMLETDDWPSNPSE